MDDNGVLPGSVAVFGCLLHLQGSGRRKESTEKVNNLILLSLF